MHKASNNGLIRRSGDFRPINNQNRCASFRIDDASGSLAQSERGQGMAEYIIIAIIVAVLVIVAIRYFGGSLGGQIKSATEQIEGAKDADGSAASTPPNTTQNRSASQAGGEGEISGSSSQGAAKAGGSTAGDSDRIAALSSKGIGEREEATISEISLDWKTLGIIGLLVLGAGGGIAFALSGDGKSKKKKKAKKKKKSLFSSGEQGQAMVEFTLSAITFLFVILGIIQFAMILNAYSLVRYAAYSAARAAIVYGSTDKLNSKMEEAARVALLPVYPRHGRSDNVRGLTENYLGAVLTDQQPYFYTFKGNFVWNGSITDVKILDQPGRGSGEVVTFDDPVDAKKALITVQVVHHYELVVPLANRIFFYVFNLSKHGGYGGETVDFVAAETDRLRRTGSFNDIEYRVPLVAHYTMRMQTDLKVP